MIDLTKAPEGATGYYVNGTSISFYNGNKYWHDFHGKWIDSLNGHEWRSENVVPIKPEWTIYNTKPLCELTDEQRGLLFNHWCNGGVTHIFNGEYWCDVPYGLNFIVRDNTYRAKQKSERELFIEAALDAMKLHPDDLAKRDIGKMFDAGFKAPHTK